jgi:hypothetical protein
MKYEVLGMKYEVVQDFAREWNNLMGQPNLDNYYPKNVTIANCCRSQYYCSNRHWLWGKDGYSRAAVGFSGL